jgi:hypothetical protein
MTNVKRTIGMRALRATWRHSLHGVVSKGRRRPLRSASLLACGALVGGAAGWLIARAAS